MRLKAFLTQASLIAALLVCAGLAGFFLCVVFRDPIQTIFAFGAEKAATATALEQEKNDTSLPARLKIPSLKIDAIIEQVGLTPAGAVGVPVGPQNVGWFNKGPRPGKVGSSIIDGHSGYKNDKPAIFDNIYKLKKGDKIYVEDSLGTTLTFVVRDFKSYKVKDNPAIVFSSSDKIAHLNLITCDGVWNPTLQTHSNRLVVFTDLVSS